MVNRCVAAGCSNTQKPGITLHKFPKDPVLRKQWERQVQRTRAHWKATESSLLCSEHFTPECFEDKAVLASKFGIQYRRKLLPDVIPTIFKRLSETQAVGSEASFSRHSRKRKGQQIATDTIKRSAVEKRERARVWFSACTCASSLDFSFNIKQKSLL